MTEAALVEQSTAPSPFLPGTSIQFAWDSTSIKTAQECWRRYLYLIIEGWRSKSPGKAIALEFGLQVHSSLEYYHNLRSESYQHDDAVRLVMRSVLLGNDIQKLPTEEELEAAKTVASDEDENDASALKVERVRTRYLLARTLVWYFENYRWDSMHTYIKADGKPAVELSFSTPVGIELSDGTEIMLSGHFDRVVSFNSQLFVKDYKTTGSMTRQWRELFDLSHQMTGYTLAGQLVLNEPVAGVVIDGIGLGVWGTKFQRHFTYRSRGQLVEYLNDLREITQQAERNDERGYWPMNTSFCRFCEFKSVCRLAPEMREGHMRGFFERKPAWNPLESR